MLAAICKLPIGIARQMRPQRTTRNSQETAESIRDPCGIGQISSLSVSEPARGGRTVAYLVERGRLESFTSDDLAAAVAALLQPAARRLETTARAALDGGDVDGA